MGEVTTGLGVGGIPSSEKGQPNGVADLGPDGKIPLDEMPFEVWSYRGDWNVATNDPSLTDGVGTAGWAYLVSVGGTRDTGHGNIVWNVGDVAVYDGTVWDQIPHGGQFFAEIGGNSTVAPMSLGTTTAQPLRLITNNVTRTTVTETGVTQMAGTFGVYNGINTAGAGVPPIYASYNSAGHSANIGATTIYAVPADGAGMYRVSAYAVETQAGTTSSTLPNVGILWTDNDSSVALSAASMTPTNPANAPGAFGNGAIVINAKGGTNIQFQTSNYASSGATAMQYAAHLRLEYLG
jgi:hypothetical protein